MLPPKSKAGLIAALLYLIAAIITLISHLLSVKMNTGDSGESAILFYLFTLPWMLLIPKSLFYSTAWSWLAYPCAVLFAGLNALIVYLTIVIAIATGKKMLRWR